MPFCEDIRRKYFTVPEIVNMLDMTKVEFRVVAKKTNSVNKAVMNGFRMYFPKCL